MHQLRHTHSTSGERQMPIKYFSYSLVQQGKSEGKPVHPSPGFMYLTVSRHVLFVYLHQGSGSGLSWDWWKLNYLFHLMQIFINHLKSVRVFVLILCQTLRFAKYMIFFEVFPFRRKRKKRSGEKKMRILLLKLVGPGLSRSWLITLIGLLKNLKQANHNKIANKRVFLIKILYNYFFGVPSSPADQYDTPFVAFHVVNFFVCRPHHFGTILKVPIHVNSLKKVKNMGIFCFQFPVVNRE